MVSNFSGPDRLSLLVGYLLHWNLLLAAYRRRFADVVNACNRNRPDSRVRSVICYVCPCEPSCTVCILSAADNEPTLVIVTDNSAEKCVAPFDGDVYIETQACWTRVLQRECAFSPSFNQSYTQDILVVIGGQFLLLEFHTYV
jgi:hypothetical protein